MITDPERWRRIESIFESALECPVEDRQDFVAEEVGDDAELALQIHRLLDADGQASDLLDRPAVPLSDSLLTDLTSDESTETEYFGPYRRLAILGKGGSGKVFLAERADDAYEQKVAIKVLHGFGNLGQAERFHQERQILAELDHPGIARLIDGGTTADGQPYLVMELVAGRPLHRYCEEEGFDLEARLRLFLKVLEPVRYAHQRLVVHRDLKPANVLVREDGEPKLLDFGIAKLIKPGVDDEDLTVEGTLLFSPSAVSPEQILGEGVTTATDIYGLGSLLYRLVASVPPQGDQAMDLVSLFHRVCEAELEPPSSHPSSWQRRVVGDLDAIILKAMAKRPEDRYASVDALADDLERFLDGRPVKARPLHQFYRLGRLIRRHRWRFALALSVLLVILAASIHAVLQAQRAARALTVAETERDNAQAISDFLIELLNAADPESGAQRDLTVREAVYRAEEMLPEHFAERPGIEAAVRHRLGMVFLSLNDLDSAQSMFAQAVDAWRRVATDDPTEIAESFVQLGRALRYDGRLEEAEKAALQAYELAEAHLDPGSLAATQSIGLLAGLYRDRNQLGEAERFFRLQVERGRLSTDPRFYSVGVSNLGVVLFDREKLNESVEYLTLGLEKMAEARGAEHPTVGLTMCHLAMVYSILGNYEEAADLVREALELQSRAYSGDHPRIAFALRLGGELELALGQWSPAAESFEKALAMYLVSRGEGHRDVGLTATQLALVRLRLGEFDEAERKITQALEVLQGAYPDEHRWVQKALTVRARLLEAQGEVDAAEQLLLSNLGTQALSANEFRYSTALGQGHLAELQRRDRRCEQALPSYELAIDALQQMGITGREWIELELGRVLCFLDQQRPEEARTRFAELEKASAWSMLPDLQLRREELLSFL